MKIVVVTISCCNPALKPQDQQYMDRIRDAVQKAHAEASVELVSGTEMVHGLADEQAKQIMPLFRKHGAATAPLMLIDGDIVFYGGVPTLEKLVDVISSRAESKDRGEERVAGSKEASVR